MSCEVRKIDSNVVGLRYAEETCPNILPKTPTWFPIEFNENKSFSPELKTETRNPISQSRQNQLGGIVDFDSKVGFTQDLTMDNCTNLLQGFMFANARERPTSKPLNAAVDQSAVKSGKLTITFVASSSRSTTPDSFSVGDIVMLSDFNSTTNNGKAVISAVNVISSTYGGGGSVELTFDKTLADDTSIVGAVTVVGKHLTSKLVFSSASNSPVILTGTDLDKLGLIVGEWIFIDNPEAVSLATGFKGFARVYSATSTQIVFDKFDSANKGATFNTTSLDVYFGTIIKNESDPDLIVTKSYQFERSLGTTNGNNAKPQVEYNTGAVSNELTITVPSAGKVTVEMGYVSLGHEVRKSGLTSDDSYKSGNRPDLTTSKEFINTSTDFARINLAVYDDSTIISRSAMFNYATDLSVKINNGVEAVKAIGTIGGIATTCGNFDVSGSITSYFTDISTIDALIKSRKVTFDTIMAKNNKAIVIDMPLLLLSGGELNIEMNKAITIPLDMNAAESAAGYTLMYVQFPYVPEV